MMLDEDTVRTTLAIDDDVLQAAKELARSEHKTLGEMISALARQALRPAPPRRRLRTGCRSCRPGQGPAASRRNWSGSCARICLAPREPEGRRA
ncbi:MAG: hypothetical protein ACRD2F_07830 [Terriglobales bacterium]